MSDAYFHVRILDAKRQAVLDLCSRRSVPRLAFSFFLVVFFGLAAASGLYFWEARAEYCKLREDEQRIQQRLASLQSKLQEQQRVLDRLRNDPAYVERVIRKQLRYARPDELVFRLED
jgi:cell division protein DivIC